MHDGSLMIETGAVSAPINVAVTAPAKPKRKAPPRALIVLGVALALGAAGAGWLRLAPATVSTDNAYVKTDRTVVAPRVRGFVAEVLVKDNQAVRAGQPLIRLDPEEYAARQAGAEGDLAVAQAGVAAATAALSRLGAEESLAVSNLRESETTIRAADAEAARADADWKRYDRLQQSGAVPVAEAERMKSQAIAASAETDRRRAAVVVNRDQLSVTGRRRAELTAALQQAIAGRDRASAALTLTRQDQDHSIIRAPIDGVVGDRQANAGDYVQPGTRLLSLMPLDQLYLTANFKETQTARMIAGQRAEVRIDALPGVALKARVDSFAPGSGSEFALLPFEPGTGNFTKIVQRVPVRLVFEPGQPELKRLRPGLSAKVKVMLEPAR